MQSCPLTCVSAYFTVPNKHGNNYIEWWFENTLSINCPYVFFTDKENIDIIRKYRKDYPTFYVECNLENFYTYKYKNKMKTHEVHSPSVELNLIWNEKIFMVHFASKLNPFNSEWFKWIDAGICSFRDIKPPQCIFPNEEKLKYLPKDKFIFSSSDSEDFESEHATETNYYHYISGTYILHKDILDTYIELYKSYLEKLLEKDNIWTDQVINTHIYKDNPQLFFKFCHGYGEMVKQLF